jgi:hypothetical protein
MKLYNTDLPHYYIAIDNNNGRTLGEYETVRDLYYAVDKYTIKHYSAKFKEMFVMSVDSVDVTPRLSIWAGFITQYVQFGDAHTTRKNIYVLDSQDRLVDIIRLLELEEKQRYAEWQKRNTNPHREYKEKLEDIVGNSLASRKHNVNKIKASYKQKSHYSNYSGETYWDFADECRWVYPRTTGAIRAALSVEKEEGEPEFRAARNRWHLPTSWDDKCSRRHYQKSSWKHNSKRRKQWKPK